MRNRPRLNDTAALVQSSSKHTTNISVRDIEGGHIIGESCDGPGGYKYTERFSKARPVLKAEVPPAPSSGRNMMSEAVEHIKK